MRSDALTGHVLDDQCVLALNDTQKVYTIFDDVQLALKYAEALISVKVNIECVIYDKDQEVMHYLPSRNIKPN
ncbi:hypothetical protein FBD94_20975 [Pedobacter hiemivivus]|uniref:Uncharacterized protein n=1 Tax=Pedobacter hiemivivus TaxID=2530454 RepID=A0A4U1G2T0_9SPHI|nr:hypothetical protein [Pedobacter hiemivivus]TKC57109.1 hypothetical protein FBD94_20975 [Pedobacter hiemivivus]